MKSYREENAPHKISCGHWYYTQASYKGDHEKLNTGAKM